MDDDRAVGSAVETKGAVKKAPSLALALFPRPELLVAGDSWLAPDGDGERADAVQNAVGPCKDTAGGK